MPKSSGKSVEKGRRMAPVEGAAISRLEEENRHDRPEQAQADPAWQRSPSYASRMGGRPARTRYADHVPQGRVIEGSFGRRRQPPPFGSAMVKTRFHIVQFDGVAIALDLTGDRYIAVPAPVSTDDASPDELAATLNTSRDGVALASVLYHDFQMPTRDLGPWDHDDEAARPRARDWFDVLLAIPSALFALWRQQPAQWVAGPAALRPVDATAIEAARRFREMRLFIPGLGRCLPHALLLRAYMRRQGHDASLVIGVRIFPFEAHSWLQAGDVILTDDLEQIAGYAPIAVG